MRRSTRCAAPAAAAVPACSHATCSHAVPACDHRRCSPAVAATQSVWEYETNPPVEARDAQQLQTYTEADPANVQVIGGTLYIRAQRQPVRAPRMRMRLLAPWRRPEWQHAGQVPSAPRERALRSAGPIPPSHRRTAPSRRAASTAAAWAAGTRAWRSKTTALRRPSTSRRECRRQRQARACGPRCGCSPWTAPNTGPGRRRGR